MNRNVDQPYKYNGTWVIDEWSKIGLHVTQRVVPTGPWFEAMRQGNFDVVLAGNCQSVVNPLLDVQRYLPNYAANYGQFDDQPEIDALRQDAARDRPHEAARADARVRETRARHQAHEIFLLWWYRMVPYRSYVKGWKISPSHYLNQDLATVWLDK